MSWISIKDELPETNTRVIVSFLIPSQKEEGQRWTTCAVYIAPRSVLEENFMDEDYSGTGDYDEEKDCYWTECGWYELNYVPETNWRIGEKVTHWMPLPKAPESNE